MPPEKKTIVVTGDGPYLGYLITEGFKQIKGATWFDRSRQAKDAIAAEKALVDAGLVKPADLKAKGAKSGGNEKDCDVLVTVKKDTVIVSQPRGKSIKIPLKKVEKMSDLQSAGKSFVAAIKKLL